MTDWRIPLSDLDYGEEERAAVERVLRSKWLSMGPEVAAFESEFAETQGLRHAVAVANGTAALHLSLAVAGVGAGDEVVQPALNFVAAANMTVALGAVPVFADIVGLEEPTISAGEVARLIGPRTKAVVAMHYGGNLARVAEIRRLCDERGLVMIEDACHAVGAPARGVKAGGFGELAAFSFFSNKNLAIGEGGMVATSSDDFAKRLRLLRSHGMTSLSWDRHSGHASSYDVVAHGYNYRLDDLHAALGRAQLAKLPANNQKRRELLRAYRSGLRLSDGWLMPFADHIESSSGHLMALLAPNADARNRLAGRLREAGIQTSMHYPCIADFEAFASSRTSAIPITREFASAPSRCQCSQQWRLNRFVKRRRQ
jgi:dTDP-4-amino-4,6-dideoxygalactose transaminase